VDFTPPHLGYHFNTFAHKNQYFFIFIVGEFLLNLYTL